MIADRQVGARSPNRAVGLPKTFERLGRRDLVQELVIDVQKRHAVFFFESQSLSYRVSHAWLPTE